MGDKFAQRVFTERNLADASALSAVLMLAVFIPLIFTVWLRRIQNAVSVRGNKSRVTK